MKAKFKQSTEACKHPYMRAGFWMKPENQFWEKPEYVVTDPKTKFSERVLSYPEKEKQYYREWVTKLQKKEILYKLHNIEPIRTR